MPNYFMTSFVAVSMALSSIVSADSASTAEKIQAAIAGEHRYELYRQRDKFRHPAETLAFFGLDESMTVVEIWPSGGWYTQIIAPVVREKGVYYAANFAIESKDVPQWKKESHQEYLDDLAKYPHLFDKVRVTALEAPEYVDIAPQASADMVLTFRNVHNWMKAGNADATFMAFAKALKVGGILGVVEHRAKPGASLERMIQTGYVTEAHVIVLAERAGFALVEKSEINANLADSTDHPRGVWTLPPMLRLGEQDRDKYRRIGESDRMTLKFKKL